MIFESRSGPCASSVTVVACAPAFLSASLIAVLLLAAAVGLGVGDAEGGPQLLLRPAVLDHVLQELAEPVVAVHLRDEVGEAAAGLDELAERLDLLDDAVRL